MPKYQSIKCLSIAAISFFAINSPAMAENPTLDWMQVLQTNRNPGDQSVALDGLGHVYLAGGTEVSLGGEGVGALFLAKYDLAGNNIWIQQWGATSNDSATSIDVDSFGNTYITGNTRGSLGGTHAGSSDAFLTKYDPSGNQLWSTQLGTSGSDNSTSVTVDGLGNAYITGQTEGVLSGTSTPTPGFDAYLAKFDATGILQWTEQFGTAQTDRGLGIDLDGSGNVYVTGSTGGTLGNTSAGSDDAYLAKYDSSGNQSWIRQIGSSGSDPSQSVAVDSTGNIFITGYTSGSLAGPNAGRRDAFLVKYDTSGNLIWTEQFGSAIDELAFAITVDDEGNPYITGRTNDTPPPGTNSSDNDIFMAKYDAAGNLAWTEYIDTVSGLEGQSLKVDGAGNIYLSGSTSSLFGSTEPLDGGFHAFVAKYSVPEPSSIVLLTLAGPLLIRRRHRKS